MATILVVEDDLSTRTLTETKLKRNYKIEIASDGLEALDVVYSKHIDLIISDVMMPNMDGYDFVKTLREEQNEIPILLLTAKETFDDKRKGFSSGTDDYMTKPINYDELILRIEALLRRSKIASKNKIEIGNTTIDSSNNTISYKTNQIDLTKKEFELLFKLVSYPNQIFTKMVLIDSVWGYETDTTEDTIKTHINKLRTKLKDIDDFEIVNIKGVGYKIELRGD